MAQKEAMDNFSRWAQFQQQLQDQLQPEWKILLVVHEPKDYHHSRRRTVIVDPFGVEIQGERSLQQYMRFSQFREYLNELAKLIKTEYDLTDIPNSILPTVWNINLPSTQLVMINESEAIAEKEIDCGDPLENHEEFKEENPVLNSQSVSSEIVPVNDADKLIIREEDEDSVCSEAPTLLYLSDEEM